MSSGVPLGAQMAWLLSTTSGCPLDVTRVEPTSHCPLTQGPLAAGGGGRAQPATTYGAMIVTVGWPLTVTRGLGAVGCACPPCEHSTVAPTCTRNPGIPSVLLQTTTSAPLLMVTVGPAITMLAPLPFWMKIPVSFTMMVAPVVLFSMMPPVGPGRSLTTIAFCSVV